MQQCIKPNSHSGHVILTIQHIKLTRITQDTEARPKTREKLPIRK
uniref:Uncharacterized protein n=1 Tax=Arundo donax TaxID=35708 RepID=A0A0A9AN60_ARUDO